VCDLESPDNARKGLVHKRSVFTVVVIHVPSDLFGFFLGRIGGLLMLLAWLLFTSALDAFSLSPADACLRSGLIFRFKPASLPVFCCWVSSSFWSAFGLLSVSWRGGLAAQSLSLSMVCGYILCGCFFGMLWWWLLFSLETFNLVVLLLCFLNHGVAGGVVVAMRSGGVEVWWWWVMLRWRGGCFCGGYCGWFLLDTAFVIQIHIRCRYLLFELWVAKVFRMVLRVRVFWVEHLFLFYWCLHHRSLTFCVLDFGGPVTFDSRWELVSSSICLSGYGHSPVDRK